MGIKRYASPEAFIINEDPNGYRTATLDDVVIDIYAFAIILWELIERKRPWGTEGIKYEMIRNAVMNGERPEISKENILSKTREISCMVSIIERAWNHVPSERPR